MSITMLALLAALSSAADGADPVAPVRTGMTLCRVPDDAKKICRENETYRTLPDGSLVEDNVLIMQNATAYFLVRFTSPAHIEGNAVCATVLRESLLKGHINAPDGKPIDHEPEHLEALAQGFAELIGKKACTSFAPGADGLVIATTKTEDDPEPSVEKARWVRPGDGYRVMPADAPPLPTT